MHPRTEELLRHLDTNRAVLCAAVDGVPSSLRETRPHPTGWSVAEVLEHLAQVEEQITRLLTAKLSEARSAGALEPEREVGPVLDTNDHEITTNRARRITTGERLVPRGEMDSATALVALQQTRAKLRELVSAYDGIRIDAVRHPHPALGVLNGYQWVAFVGSHEARHAAQIREAGERLTSP